VLGLPALGRLPGLPALGRCRLAGARSVARFSGIRRPDDCRFRLEDLLAAAAAKLRTRPASTAEVGGAEPPLHVCIAVIAPPTMDGCAASVSSQRLTAGPIHIDAVLLPIDVAAQKFPRMPNAKGVCAANAIPAARSRHRCTA